MISIKMLLARKMIVTTKVASAALQKVGIQYPEQESWCKRHIAGMAAHIVIAQNINIIGSLRPLINSAQMSISRASKEQILDQRILIHHVTKYESHSPAQMISSQSRNPNRWMFPT
jgi:hypothetical protein